MTDDPGGPVALVTGASQELKNACAAAVPMRRMGAAEDVGATVASLASDAAKFIVGQKIAVNGGNTLA